MAHFNKGIKRSVMMPRPSQSMTPPPTPRQVVASVEMPLTLQKAACAQDIHWKQNAVPSKHGLQRIKIRPSDEGGAPETPASTD